jgi:two-component system, sensor histidine kinase RegB
MRGREMPGLGLGFFIAKTLLARSGAKISLKNKEFPQRGAIVRVRWKRADFERPLISQPLDDKMLDTEEPEQNEAGSKPSNGPEAGGSDKSETPPLAEIH